MHILCCYWLLERPIGILVLIRELLHETSHRVGRVLSFSPGVGIGTPPTPTGECALPPLVPGEGHTLWQERGWESSDFDEGTHTVVLCTYKYFVRQSTNTYPLLLLAAWTTNRNLVLIRELLKQASNNNTNPVLLFAAWTTNRNSRSCQGASPWGKY